MVYILCLVLRKVQESHKLRLKENQMEMTNHAVMVSCGVHFTLDMYVSCVELSKNA
jgi:hypothetical protein